MRVPVGWLMFLLAVASAVCAIGVLVANTWYGFPAAKSIKGFLAFGICMMVAGSATAALWDGRRPLQNVLGCAGALTGITCAVIALFLVWPWINDTEAISGALRWRLAGFVVSAVMCGGFGITLLIEADKK